MKPEVMGHYWACGRDETKVRSTLNWVEQQKSVTKFGESDIKKKIFEYDDNHKSSS